MSGNRGAKGSITDRVISMLYRYRYKLKKSEEDYTILKKEKQKNYINNLKRFKETNDLNTLDNIDRKKINNTILNIRVNEKYFETEKKTKKVIINQNNKSKKEKETVVIKRKPRAISVENPKIELKNDSVNLKKEEKKVKDEIVILKEVNHFIVKSKENLNEIKKDIESIKVNTKNENQDMTIIKEKYDKLKIQVDKLKYQYDTIKNKYDLSEFKILESIKLISSIDNYKNIANLNELETMVNVCKKEIDSISGIKVVNESKNKLGNNIDSIEENQKKIKIKFIKSKDSIKEISDIENTINKELQNQTEIINEMYSKASFIDKEIIKTKQYIGKGKILSSLFKITLGMLTIPLSKKRIMGYAVGAVLVNKGLKDLNRNYETKEKITVNLKYEDISKKLIEVTDILDYTQLVLSDSLTEVKKLKENFKSEYSNYSNVLPDYEDNLNKLNALELSIINNQKKVNMLYKNLDNEKEINNKKLQKVKKIKNQY